MSLIQSIYNQFLTIRRNNLQYQLMQNHMAMLSAIKNPPNPQEAYKLDNFLALNNAQIQTELAIIEAQCKGEDKKLNILA